MRKDVLSLFLFAVPGAQSKPHPLKLDDGLKRKLRTAWQPGRNLRLHNGIHLDENNLIVYEAHRIRVDDETGEEACENQGFNKAECSMVGCCQWDDDQCWSDVGTQLCYSNNDDNGIIYVDDGNNNDDNGIIYVDDGNNYDDNSVLYGDDESVDVDDTDDAFDDGGDYYTDDYYGTGDEMFEFLFSLSPMCTLSYFSLLENLEDMPVPMPEVVLETDSAIGYAFDFGADKEGFDMFLSSCTKFGGQNVMLDIDFSDSCMSPNFLNVPQCVGAPCNEDDLIIIGSSVSGDPSLEDCTVSTEVKSLDGTSDIGISASDVCVEDMMVIFLLEDVYENFDDEITLDEETGELTGDIEEFSEICESTGGRIVIGTVVYNDECGEDDFSSVPVCVAKTCGNDEAISFLEYFLIATIDDTSCVDVKLSTEEMDSDTDSETSSKSTKSSKKGVKSVKTAKLTKSPKAAKTKSTKSLKAVKGEKSEKAPKAGKA